MSKKLYIGALSIRRIKGDKERVYTNESGR